MIEYHKYTLTPMWDTYMHVFNCYFAMISITTHVYVSVIICHDTINEESHRIERWQVIWGFLWLHGLQWQCDHETHTLAECRRTQHWTQILGWRFIQTRDHSIHLFPWKCNSFIEYAIALLRRSWVKCWVVVSQTVWVWIDFFIDAHHSHNGGCLFLPAGNDGGTVTNLNDPFNTTVHRTYVMEFSEDLQQFK